MKCDEAWEAFRAVPGIQEVMNMRCEIGEIYRGLVNQDTSDITSMGTGCVLPKSHI